MADNDHHRSGHRKFWEKVCNENMSQLRAYAGRLASAKFDVAEDLLQGTLCEALAADKNPREIQKNPLNYLLGIMHNAWVDTVRGKNEADVQSLEQLKFDQHPTVDPDVFRVLEHEERVARFEAEHGPLNPREKFLLKRHLMGHTNQEIADELHEDVKVIRYDLNAVKSKVRYRLKRAKALAAKSGKLQT